MQYLLLIYTDESKTLTEDEKRQQLADYGAFTAELSEAGAMVGGNALQPTGTATSVRLRKGETMITDGPFAETVEALGGYYLVQCNDLDEALQWAAKIPDSKRGTIEVRPILEIGE